MVFCPVKIYVIHFNSKENTFSEYYTWFQYRKLFLFTFNGIGSKFEFRGTFQTLYFN